MQYLATTTPFPLAMWPLFRFLPFRLRTVFRNSCATAQGASTTNSCPIPVLLPTTERGPTRVLSLLLAMAADSWVLEAALGLGLGWGETCRGTSTDQDFEVG